MEALTLRELHALPDRPKPRRATPDGTEWDWVYDDPDLAPFRASTKTRPEVPLTAWA